MFEDGFDPAPAIERKEKFVLADKVLSYCPEEQRHHRLEDFELTRYHRENVTLPSDIVDAYDGSRDECYWCGYAIPRRYFEDAKAVRRNKERNFSLQELDPGESETGVGQ